MGVNLIHNHNLGEATEVVTPSSDYIGFTYNGVHSSELGIVRTSDGSRFNENLLPTMQDKTVQVPGGDGTYFFGSYYTQRQFNISFAFDSLTEVQFARLQQVFGDKKIHDLTFDERPYKTYKAKVTGTSTIKYIVFDEKIEEKNQRVYKGEGSIQFTCYNPFAVCSKKFLKDYADYPNVEEWAEASGLNDQGKDSSGNDLDNYTSETRSIITYNPGVKESDWQMFYGFAGVNLSLEEGASELILNLQSESGVDLGTLKLKNVRKKGEDTHICINTKNNTIEGAICTTEGANNNLIVSVTKTGNLYNEFLMGTFFKIPMGSAKIVLTNANYSKIGAKLDDKTHRHLFYNYYYF